MKNSALKHLLLFIFVEIIIGLFLLLLNDYYFKTVHPSVYNPSQGLLIVFFILICTFIHGILLFLGNSSPKQFIPYFMGSMGLKLFATFGFMILYVLLHKTQAKSFLINCTLAYFIYTFAHITLILIAVNSKNGFQQQINSD
ncbi:MAG: hypothetical protein H7331_07460 [Bacteroidia bacterium]|nr:hypothetical protein [Bacteroidia bacterium]